VIDGDFCQQICFPKEMFKLLKFLSLVVNAPKNCFLYTVQSEIFTHQEPITEFSLIKLFQPKLAEGKIVSSFTSLSDCFSKFSIKIHLRKPVDKYTYAKM
jgi:hypothetical protein